MEDSFQPEPSSPGDGTAGESDPSRRTYPPEAFEFVREGLEYTVHAIHGPPSDLSDGEDRHVNGRQLSLGLRDHAIPVPEVAVGGASWLVWLLRHPRLTHHHGKPRRNALPFFLGLADIVVREATSLYPARDERMGAALHQALLAARR